METKRKINFKQARDFGETISVTFEFIRENFKGLSLSLLLIAGPAAVLLGVVNTFYFINIFEERSFTILGLNYLVLFLVFQLVIGVTYGYINLYLDSDLEKIKPSDVWEEVKRNFGKSSATMILGAMWVGLASILLIIPGIYLMIVFSILFAVRYREKITFSDAFSRCSQLTKGCWWPTFGLVFVLGIIQAVLSYILQAPMVVIVAMKTLGLWHDNSFFSTTLILITTVIGTFSHLFYVISSIGMSFHYYSLVEKKEALGLLEKIENMQEQA